MAQDESLKPKPVPQPPPGAQSLPQMPGEGRPPLRTGRVYMSDYTKEQLRKLGWQDGDPIPGDLGHEIQKIQRDVEQDRDTASWEKSPPPGYKPVKAEFINIDDLPAEKQEELREYLAQYKAEIAAQDAEAARQQQVEQNMPQGMSPQMQQATQEAARISAEAERARSTAVDDRGQQPQAQPQPQPQTQPQPRPEPQQPQLDPSEDSPSESSGITELPKICPRCLWDQSDPFDINPTQEDKETFLAAILGLGRFEKKYAILNGKMQVCFRTLTSEEIIRLNEQISWHVRRGEILGDGEYYLWLMEYRMVLATSQIEVDGNVLRKMPSLKEFEKTHPNVFSRTRKVTEPSDLPPSGLPAMRDWFYEEVVAQEPLRRILGQQHRIFQQLAEGLEALSASEDFWKGIELPA